MSDPVRMETGIQMLAAACPEQAPGTWDLLRGALAEVDEVFRRWYPKFRQQPPSEEEPERKAA